MVKSTLIIIFAIACQVYALNGGAFKKIEVSPDLWKSMVYKIQFSTTSSLSEKAATCLIDLHLMINKSFMWIHLLMKNLQ